MSLTCPHCHLAFTLTAVAVSSAATATPPPAPAFTFSAPPSTPPTHWFCPVHRLSKIVPAGTSAKTGNAYAAFWACPERDCAQRPPRGFPVPHAPAPVADAQAPTGLDELV